MQEKTLLSKQEKIAKLKEYLDKTRVDEGVVKDTLNVNTDRINPHMLLAASTKVLKVNREEVEPDDRDNLKYSDFLGLEDFIHEHVHKDAGKLQRKAKMKMDQKKNLDWMHAGFFTPQVRSIIVGNSLSQNVEGNNPLELMSTSHRVTKMGEGGLQSTQSIPEESRAVSPSSFGLFDALQNVESTAIGVTNYLARNVIKGNDRKLYKLLKNNKTGKIEWVSHDKMLNSKVRIPDA